MDFREWEPIYESILIDFGYNRKEDEHSANLLYSMAKKKCVDAQILRNKIHEKKVTICGAAENLEGNIKKIDGTVIAADEATSILMDEILPDIIVTDLDGNVDDQIIANGRDSVAVIHAHGDNVEAIKKYVPRFRGKIVLTTQSRPFDNVHNFGGFTDGDRAFFMAKHFGAKEIVLLGFDFEKPRQKEGKDTEIKRRKLRWAKKLIEGY
ncbi:MAG: 6-hydroxymethylpterin diphosphokinase MptE-like protein [Candidatus Thermoplasmatota archaeon]|nr:6-hydroxymethylpterin diphosphokinase MptE-like protein [Candidatus Thermoplasmatota archaeon]